MIGKIHLLLWVKLFWWIFGLTGEPNQVSLASEENMKAFPIDICSRKESTDHFHQEIIKKVNQV